jgi:hypothetical protein
MGNYAEQHDGIELHMVGDRLFITDVEQPEKQVSLSARALDGLVEYLSAVGAIAGRVQFLKTHTWGSHLYRLVIEDRDNRETDISLDFIVYEGEVEDFAPVGSYDDTSEDKGGIEPS